MSLTQRNSSTMDPLELLSEASERNLTVEIHRRRTGGELVIARSRILGLDESAVYFDRPQSGGSPAEFASGQFVDVYLSLYDCLYTFRTEVLSASELIDLNQHKRVNGISLAIPQKIRPGQRRSHYRVSLAGMKDVPVHVHLTSNVNPDACPIDARRFRGRLADISMGGMSVVIDQSIYSVFIPGQSLFVSFSLPDDEEEFNFLGVVRQSRPIHDGRTSRVGAEFVGWPDDRALRIKTQRLQRFITAVQRMQMKRAS